MTSETKSKGSSDEHVQVGEKRKTMESPVSESKPPAKKIISSDVPANPSPQKSPSKSAESPKKDTKEAHPEKPSSPQKEIPSPTKIAAKPSDTALEKSSPKSSASKDAFKLFGKSQETTTSWDDLADDDDKHENLGKMKRENTPAPAKPILATPSKPSFGIQQSSLGIFKASAESDDHTSDVGFKFGSGFTSSTTFSSFASGQKSGFSAFATPNKGSFADLLNTPSKTEDKTKNTKEEEEDGDDREEEDTTKSPPRSPPKQTIQLPPVPVITGEEEETTLHQTRCKLYVWVEKESNWKERGLGSLKLNKKKSDDSYRLVMRSDGVFRLILNVKVVKGLPYKHRDEKFVEVISCETPPTLTKFLMKFKNREVAKAFVDVLETHFA